MRPALGIGVLVAALGAAGAWLWARRDHQTPADRLFSWAGPGQSNTYTVHYLAAHEQQLLAPSAAGIDGRIDIEGQLSISGLDAGDGSRRVALSFHSFSHATLDLLGQRVEDATAVLQGHEVVIELDTFGAVQALSFDPDAPKLFRHLARSIALELQWVTTSEAAEWEVEEETPRGRSQTLYSLVPAGPSPTLSKARDDYDEIYALSGLGVRATQTIVDSQATASFTDEGVLIRHDGHETIVVEDGSGAPVLTMVARLELEQRETGARQRPAPLLADRDVEVPGPPGPSISGEKQALLAATGGMTGEAMLADLQRYAAAGTLPDHDLWFSRAIALLRLQPELCRSLLPLFELGRTGQRGRALILDLLASAGHPVAQEVMLAALSSPTVTEVGERSALLQRLSGVIAPTDETLLFVRDAYEKNEDETGTAAAFTLGAVVGRFGSDAVTPEAEAAHERLRQDLEAAREPRQIALLLRALANAGLEADLPLFVRAAGDDESTVRRAAAIGLRRYSSSSAIEVLMALVGDASAEVQRAALLSLGSTGLNDRVVAQLAEIVSAKKLFDENADLLVNLLVSHGSDSETPRQIFAELLAQGPIRPELAARLRALLEGS